jgi:HK97 family phage portal protein
MGFATSIAEGVRRKGFAGTPSVWSLHDFLSRGQPTWSGMEVTAENALHIAVYFAGVRVICEDIGKLPFIVYRESPDGKRERATDSPYWRLIHDRPNKAMTSQQFREYMTAAAINRGDGLAVKSGMRGQVPELLPLHPDTARIELTSDFSLMYHVRHNDGTETHLPRDKVFHYPGLTLNGYTGVSVIEYARQTLGNIHGGNRQAGTFFGNGMRPSGILSHPGKASDDAKKRVKETLVEASSGNKTNSVLFFDEGMTFTPVSLNAHDSQFIESRTFEVLEVCRWLRLKPHKVAELTRATFSNIEQESQEHVTDTLMPHGQRWADAVTQQIITEPNMWAELNYDALLRGTTLDRYQAYQIALGGNNGPGFITREEIRIRENLPAVPQVGTLHPGPSLTPSSGGDDDGNQAN